MGHPSDSLASCCTLFSLQAKLRTRLQAAKYHRGRIDLLSLSLCVFLRAM